MQLYKKILVSISILMASVVIFFIFLMYNFPYSSLIKKLDLTLNRKYDMNIKATRVEYGFPNKVYIEGADLELPDDYGSIKIPKMEILFKIFNFSKNKEIFIIWHSSSVSSMYFKASLGPMNMNFLIDIKKLRRQELEGLRKIEMLLGPSRLKELTVAGVGINDVPVSKVDFEILNRGGKFNFNRGILESRIVKTRVKGSFSENFLNIDAEVKIEKDLYSNYPDLKPLLQQFIGNSGVILKIRGNPEKPRVKIVKS